MCTHLAIVKRPHAYKQLLHANVPNAYRQLATDNPPQRKFAMQARKAKAPASLAPTSTLTFFRTGCLPSLNRFMLLPWMPDRLPGHRRAKSASRFSAYIPQRPQNMIGASGVSTAPPQFHVAVNLPEEASRNRKSVAVRREPWLVLAAPTLDTDHGCTMWHTH